MLYKAPWIFSKFYAAAKVFIDKVTREKIMFLSGDVSDGSSNDKLLRKLIGNDWKYLTGVDVEDRDSKVARGYNHEEYTAWAKAQEQRLQGKDSQEEQEEQEEQDVLRKEAVPLDFSPEAKASNDLEQASVQPVDPESSARK